MARYGTVKTQMKELAATASQQPEEIRERRTAAEDTLGALEANIGKAGTYDLPGNPGSGPVAPAPSDEAIEETGLLSKDGYKFGSLKGKAYYDAYVKAGYSKEEAAAQLKANGQKEFDDTGIFKSEHTKLGIGATGGRGGTSTVSLDKDKALAQMQSSSAFRQVSRMMAESEQMLARSGPLYDEMMRSTQLPIMEGSATVARENTEAIRKALQRGGAARRDGFAAIAKIRAQEQSNAARGQALAKAHTEMDLWARKNASEVINFAHGWATNQAGIRESYQSAMDSASQLMSQSALPFIFAASQKEQEYRDAKSAQSRGKVMKQITGVLGVVSSVASIVGAIYGGPGAGDSIEKTNEATQGRRIGSTNYTSGGFTPSGAGGSGSNNYIGADEPGSSSGEAAPGTGARAAAGIASMFSSRDFKMNNQSIDENEIYERFMTLPVEKWEYIWEPGVQHVGTYAEDFKAAFGVGDGKTINPIDYFGVLHIVNRVAAKRAEAAREQ